MIAGFIIGAVWSFILLFVMGAFLDALDREPRQYGIPFRDFAAVAAIGAVVVWVAAQIA